jgi:hypothetical protein
MKKVILQNAKEYFMEQFPSNLFTVCVPQFELLDANLIYPRINQICAKKGKDKLTLMSVNEQGGISSAVTLIYPDEAYIIIKDMAKASDLYLTSMNTGALYLYDSSESS